MGRGLPMGGQDGATGKQGILLNSLRLLWHPQGEDPWSPQLLLLELSFDLVPIGSHSTLPRASSPLCTPSLIAKCSLRETMLLLGHSPCPSSLAGPSDSLPWMFPFPSLPWPHPFNSLFPVFLWFPLGNFSLPPLFSFYLQAPISLSQQPHGLSAGMPCSSGRLKP